MGRTINICEYVQVDCDIDVDEYKGQFLRAISDEEILDEAVKRHILPERNAETPADNPYEFKRYLCDFFDMGYMVPTEEVLDMVKSKLGIK